VGVIAWRSSEEVKATAAEQEWSPRGKRVATGLLNSTLEGHR